MGKINIKNYIRSKARDIWNIVDGLRDVGKILSLDPYESEKWKSLCKLHEKIEELIDLKEEMTTLSVSLIEESEEQSKS